MKQLGHLRFCTLAIDDIIDIDNEDEVDTMPRFTHDIGELLNDVVSMIYHGLPPVNRSIVKEKEFGSKDTGCTGSIKRNQTGKS